METEKILNKIFAELTEKAYDGEYHVYDYKITNQIIRANIEALMEAKVFSSNAVLAVSLPLEDMLNELPDNRPLYHDSGSWQIRSDNMEDVLYQQATNESFCNFIKRCYQKENKLMDLGQ